MGYVIDTCVWIDVERGRLSAADVASVTGQEPVFLSPITIAELNYGVEMAQTAAIRHMRLASLSRLSTRPLLPIDEQTGILAGTINAALRRSGRAGDFRIHDVWMACQAIQYGYRLLTRNLKDFEDIPGLQLVSI